MQVDIFYGKMFFLQRLLQCCVAIFFSVQKLGIRNTANMYEATRKNLKINKNVKVICQGFTGKQVSECALKSAVQLSIRVYG